MCLGRETTVAGNVLETWTAKDFPLVGVLMMVIESSEVVRSADSGTMDLKHVSKMA